MDTPLTHEKIERINMRKEEGDRKREEDHEPSTKHHQNPNSPTITSLPPSSSSSPSNDFSFTLSFNPSSTTRSPEKFKQTTSSAVDLSPADDIFFQGHILPQHLVSASNPASSNNLNRPVRDLIGDHKLNKNYSNGCCTIKKGDSSNNSGTSGGKDRIRPKSFMFRLSKWRKAFESGDQMDDDAKKLRKKKKVRLMDVGGVLKRYMRLIQPLFSRWGEKEKRNIRHPPNCVSGHLNSKLKDKGAGKRRGVFSAPASMRASPTNSGLLVAAATITSSDSTMEELQNAIQAAIAHCKNSIEIKEDKRCKC